MHFSNAIIFAAVLTLTGCSGSAVVSITNQSSLTVSNVVLSGSGFTNRFDSIAPRGEKHFTVRHCGGSGLRVAFDAAGGTVESSEQDYFESDGYQVTAVIGTNLSVSVSSTLDL